MEVESMEEEAAALLQDPNHNNWELRPESPGLPAPAVPAPPSPDSPDTGYSCRKRCDTPPGKALLGISSNTSKFLMNVITVDDYRSTYWPKLDSAIDQLLTQSPGDYIPISYEQIYSCVYKCVCQQHSEQMYSDLMRKITSHLERVSQELQNKFYIETKLNRDLKDDLIKLFTDHVAEKHIYSLMPLLLEAQSTPFQITPSTMASIVKGLYTLRPGKCPSLTLAEAKLRPGERGPWGAA
ncbi:hypothetical protein FKM82_014670 [Ascaphus truei]